MASLVAPLASGFVGAASGTAEFYNEGTSTLALVYSDAHGVTQETTHALDANGGITRYVEGRTDVVVKSAVGATVRTFTWGTDSRESRVENAGFTGTDANGATVAGGRTTVDAVLTRLYASLGATDGQALVNGVATNISAALASSTGVFYSVKAYGAAGNGTVNDTSAIQITINAASAAGGGWVVFPPGTYKIQGQITVPTGSKVNLVGLTETGCSIVQHTTAINGWFLFGVDSTLVQNLTFNRNAVAMTGRMLQTAGRLNLIGCSFGGFGGPYLYGTATAEITGWGCKFTLDEDDGRVCENATGAVSRFLGCSISQSNYSCFTGSQHDVIGCNVKVLTNTTGVGNVFSGGVNRFIGGRVDATALTADTYRISDSGTLITSGASFEAGSGATLSLVGFSVLIESASHFGATGTVSIGTPTGGSSSTRDTAVVSTGGIAASYTPSGAYGYHEFHGTNAAFTLNAPSPGLITGQTMVVVYKNGSGVAVTPVLGAGLVATSGVPAAVNNNRCAVFVIVRAGSVASSQSLVYNVPGAVAGGWIP